MNEAKNQIKKILNVWNVYKELHTYENKITVNMSHIIHTYSEMTPTTTLALAVTFAHPQKSDEIKILNYIWEAKENSHFFESHKTAVLSSKCDCSSLHRWYMAPT